MKVVSFFSGAGGLDLGFSRAGFDIVWSNEFDKSIWDTYRKNHPSSHLDTRSITEIHEDEVPDCDGIIGGPPCQSWSEAGTLRGIEDQRGQLFYDFIRILKSKKPKFFLAENVSGMLAVRHQQALENIKELFIDSGYNLYFKLINAADYGIPQDRKRVFFIGIRKDLGLNFSFPPSKKVRKNLKDSIWDLRLSAVPAEEKNKSVGDKCNFLNHEYMIGGFSPIYMSRNRVRTWNDQSFTIQAGGRQAPLHPQAPLMIKVEKNKQIFDPSNLKAYRRLSVRECARIQTFPDDFEFIYGNLTNAYKMIGNAVPVDLAQYLATSIKLSIEKV